MTFKSIFSGAILGLLWLNCLQGQKAWSQTVGGKLPLWEVGLGAMYLKQNQYRGSDETRSYFWPLPYFIYRGDQVEVKNSALSGQLYKAGRFRVGLSLNGQLRVTSGRSAARAGMPSLDPTFELGPQASYDLWVAKDRKNWLALYWPLRYVGAAEFWRVSSVGFFSVPYLAWIANPQDWSGGFFSVMSLALMFGSSGYHNYYYSVPRQYATAERPAYSAQGGLSGWHYTWFVSRKWKKLYGFAFFRYDNLNGSAIEGSPLVVQNHYFAFGVGAVFYFLQSEKNVYRRILK